MIEKDVDQRENKTLYEKLSKEVEKGYVNPGNGAGKMTLDTEWAFRGSGWRSNTSLDSTAQAGHTKASSYVKPALSFFFLNISLMLIQSTYLILDSFRTANHEQTATGNTETWCFQNKTQAAFKMPWLNEPGCGLTVPQMKRQSTEPKWGWKDLLAQIQCHANAVMTL